MKAVGVSSSRRRRRRSACDRPYACVVPRHKGEGMTVTAERSRRGGSND